MKKMKGQAALDQLASNFLILVATSILLAGMLLFSNDAAQQSMAKDAVYKIGNGVDYVDALGEGTQTIISVRIPSGVDSFSIADSTIMMRIETASGPSDIFYNTKGELNGSLPQNSGWHKLSISAMQNGVVQILDYAG